MPQFELKYNTFNENSILIEWPKSISPDILKDILSFKSKIESELASEILFITSAYNSLLISYKDKSDIDILFLKTLYKETPKKGTNNYKLWKIPVCYDESFGIDLKEMAFQKNITIEKLIKLHCSSRYLIYTIGFLPGFLYLGGLDDKLTTPRRANPRLKINKGDVGIGGNQTGIYPNSSPGGWNIIGNSPISFFTPKDKKPCFAVPGDSIQFYSITKKEHELIRIEVETGIHKLDFEIL